MTAEGEDRLSTGVEGLDAMIGGGYLRGDFTLVAGSPGTGKTTLGLHFLAAGIREGEPGIFFTSEYLPQNIYRDAARRGWPMRRWEEEGRARVISAPHDVLFDPEAGGISLLDEMIRDIGARRLVLDSISTWRKEDPRPVLEGIMNHLRLTGVTTLVTAEVPQVVGPSVQITPWGLEFLADNLLLLQYVEIDGVFRKALTVLKFRGGDHDRSFRELRMTDAGIEVAAGFRGVERLLSGSPTRAFAERVRDLV